MKKMMKEVGIDFHHNDCGILHIYKNQKSWDKAQRTLERFKDTGWGRVKTKTNLIKYNIKSNDVVGATLTKGDSVGDIHSFCQNLSRHMMQDPKYDYSFRINKIVRTEDEVFWSNPRDMAFSLTKLKKEFD